MNETEFLRWALNRIAAWDHEAPTHTGEYAVADLDDPKGCPGCFALRAAGADETVAKEMRRGV